jgi:hypothetical protein
MTTTHRHDLTTGLRATDHCGDKKLGPLESKVLLPFFFLRLHSLQAKQTEDRFVFGPDRPGGWGQGSFSRDPLCGRGSVSMLFVWTPEV